MKKYLLIILAIGILTSSCASVATQTATIPVTTRLSTSTSTIISPFTFTSTLNTPIFTVISAIPTITPTFDVSTIVTATLAEKATCPTTKSAENLNFDFLNVRVGMDGENRAHAEENVLNFLNMYGAEPLILHLQYNSYRKEGENFIFQDLTNDGTPELAIGLTSFFIFSCKNGKYEKIFEIPPDGYLRPSRIFSIKDNNRNGIPETTLLVGVWSQGGHAYQIYEWNGEAFRNLLVSDLPEYPDAGEIWVEATGKIHYEDIDHDLLTELILDSGIPVWESYSSGFPWRNKGTYYEWNGKNYVPSYYAFVAPEFRFQAVQDADLAFTQNELEKALSLYQDAIFSDKLKDYSPEIRRNLQENWMAQIGYIQPTPTPYPSDASEYPRLAAYSYFRIMLLHLAQEYDSDAMIVFSTLQQKFPENDPGNPYAEIASAFMDEYQDTNSLIDACSVVIKYAIENPEVLVPLGSDYHGWQSHEYKPEDICPFR